MSISDHDESHSQGHRLWLKPFQDVESGLTLIEVLMAILVLAIVIGSIAPPLVAVVSTRVRNRQVDQSTQVARRAVEAARIALYNWNGSYSTVPTDIPNPVGTSPSYSYSDLTQVPAPNSVCTTSSGNPAVNPQACSALSLQPFYFDGQVNYYVQSFRANQCGTATEIIAFDMGVRVYPLSAVNSDGTTLVSGITTTAQGASFTNLTKKNAPLSTFYTTIIRPETKLGLTNYNTLCPVHK